MLFSVCGAKCRAAIWWVITQSLGDVFVFYAVHSSEI